VLGAVPRIETHFSARRKVLRARRDFPAAELAATLQRIQSSAPKISMRRNGRAAAAGMSKNGGLISLEI